MTRWDETWHRLRDWTVGQAPSERLSAQVLVSEGYEGIDPSHPLGGPDGGRDAHCTKDGLNWIMAAYFPRGQQSDAKIEAKFRADLEGARKYDPGGFVFLTNQEITLAPRERLRTLGGAVVVEIYHLERIAFVLDKPDMAPVRKQYLDIDAGPLPIAVELTIAGSAHHFVDSAETRERYISNTIHSETQNHDDHDEEAEVNFFTGGVLPSISNANIFGERGRGRQSRAQLHQHLDKWAQRVRDEWPEIEAKLVAAAWPGLRFHLRNVGQVFLNDVQVIITIKGAQGVDWGSADDFDLTNFIPEVYSPSHQHVFTISPPNIELMRTFRAKDYPVSWENTDKDTLEITIDLKHLRPMPEWRSDDDDLVLIALRRTGENLTAEWTVTAQGYGNHYSGFPLLIPVQVASFPETLEPFFAAESDDD